MKDDKFTAILTRLLDLYGGEYSLLGDLFKILGREQTLKMMEIFKGETITFPSEELVDDKLKILEGYVMYKIECKPWNEVAESLYGKGSDSSKRKYLRNCIRDVSRKVKSTNLRLEDITVKDIEKFKEDRDYVKEDLNESNNN